MSLDALIILAGCLVALLPFLGFPQSMDTVMFFLLGIFTVSLGIVVRRRNINWSKVRKERPEQPAESISNSPEQHGGAL